MPYIGPPPQNRILSSADIAQGAVTLDDINFTDQPTNMDITGVIDKHTMRLADGVTITGDVTISDDLVLSKISDDGNAITMTNDGSSRTITGSGSIEASTLSQTPNQSLTGMTGTVGSAVTGGSGLSVTGMTGTLGSAIVFDDAHKDIDCDADSWALYLSSSTSVSSSAVVFDTVHKLGSNITVNAGIVTITKAGWYLVIWTLANVFLDGAGAQFFLKRNGSVIGHRMHWDHQGDEGFGYMGKTLCNIVEIAAGDTLNIHGSGYIYGAGATDELCDFQGIRLGA